MEGFGSNMLKMRGYKACFRYSLVRKRHDFNWMIYQLWQFDYQDMNDRWLEWSATTLSRSYGYSSNVMGYWVRLAGYITPSVFPAACVRRTHNEEVKRVHGEWDLLASEESQKRSSSSMHRR